MITDIKEPKTHNKQPRFYEKTAVAANLVLNHGVDPKTALTLARGNTPGESTVRGFVKKVSKYALTAPQMVKLAHKAVKDTLEMKEIKYQAEKVCSGIGVVDYTETIVPSITNRLAAAAMVLDRDQPIKHVNINVNIEADPFDLGELQ